MKEGGRAASSVPGMEISYDSDGDVAYVRLMPRAPGQSKKQIVVEDDDRDHPIVMRGPIVIDLDADGHIIGFEILGASELLSPKILDGAR